MISPPAPDRVQGRPKKEFPSNSVPVCNLWRVGNVAKLNDHRDDPQNTSEKNVTEVIRGNVSKLKLVMKKNSITAVLIVLISGIGFGVGWLLKPDSAHRESAKNKDLPAKKSSFVSRKKAPLVTPGKLGRSENRPEKPDHAFRSAETDRTKTDDIKEHFHEALMTRHKAKDEAQIQRLIGALGMTDWSRLRELGHLKS